MDIAARIEHLRSLEPDWDDGGAPKINEAALLAAEDMAKRLSLAPIGAPHSIVPAPDGGVVIGWDDPPIHLSIEFEPGGGISPFLAVFETVRNPPEVVRYLDAYIEIQKVI